MDDDDAVLAANKAFYDAFEALDLAAMSRVWAHRPTATCIHPGWEILSGWDEIRESWRAIFANTGYMRFKASNIRVHVVGNSAWVCCVENLFQVVEGHTIHSQVACTNLFLRTGEGWKMVLHHGSPIASAQSVSDAEGDGEFN
jgi:ketosteroid isomerase-like protein